MKETLARNAEWRNDEDTTNPAIDPFGLKIAGGGVQFETLNAACGTLNVRFLRK
jgi:hypothetical protein